MAIEYIEEPEPALVEGAKLPVNNRYCPRCTEPVGRHGRDRGDCPGCGTPFDFLPRLRPGDVVDYGRYRVRGVLNHGGFGWAYLADDTQLGLLVVLKGLISDRVAATVQRERAHLVELDHPYIVQIRGYVTDGQYLVLGYAGGATIRQVVVTEPLEQVLALGLQLLEALDYLHGKGFLHCDVKPANIVRGADRVRLIDFGAVRTFDDTTPVGTFTARYSPQHGDPEYTRPTAGFDLYCAARTLEELCRNYLEFQGNLPGVDSLRLLLDRATHQDRGHRFTSARQFAEQLSGVIQQVVVGRSVPHRSVVFASMTRALDGGLGEVTPIESWVGARVDVDGMLRAESGPFACPTAAQIPVALPGLLSDPWAVEAGGTAAVTEAQLNACHAAVRQGSGAAAAALLKEAALPDADWRSQWYGGLISLTAQRADLAAQAFGRVRAAVPGELAPLLALGLCAELRNESATAAILYERVSTTDESLIAAHFGLARILVADGRRADATIALYRVPGESRFEHAARIAAVRSLSAILVTEAGTVMPTPDDVARARSLEEGLKLDEFSRALLDTEFAHAEWAVENASATPSSAARLKLEKAFRRLAGFAASDRSHAALIDLANAVRPVTIWSWLCPNPGADCGSR